MPPSFFLLLFFFEFVIGEFEVKRAYIDGQTLDGIFADIVVYPHCAFNELQGQDEVEDKNYTNLQVRVLTKNQTTKTSRKEFYFSTYHTQKQVL